MRKKVTWTAMKTLSVANKTCYSESSTQYHLYSESQNGRYSFECALVKGTPNAIEFVNTWKPTAVKTN